MYGVDPKYIVYLGLLVTIEQAIGHGTVSLTNLVPADWAPYITSWCNFLAFIGTSIMTCQAAVTGPQVGPLIDKPTNPVKSLVQILLVAILLSAFLAPRAFAADLPATKAINRALSAGYPTTSCGLYYGIGTGGSAGAVADSAVGTRIVQGDLDAVLGYSCPFATDAFWFVEGRFGFNNLNGNVNGLALSGPLIMMQRAGAGSPLNKLLPNPFGNGLALPSVPLLPAGVTAGAATPYLFAGMVEQDISTQLGLGGHNRQWVIAPMIGIGLLTRLNGNASVVDTWAGWQMNSESFCPGGGSSCAKLGNAVRVGVSINY